MIDENELLDKIEEIQDYAYSNNIGSNEEQLEARIEIVKYVMNQVSKLPIHGVSHCPSCNSDNLHQYKLHHIHCKDCKENFNKSCD